MHDPLTAPGRRSALESIALQVENDVPPHAPDSHNARLFEDGQDVLRRRLQRLGLLAQPNRLDDIAGDTLVQSARNGFYFREFRHRLLVYGKAAAGSYLRGFGCNL